MTGLDMIQKTDSPMISVVIPVYNMEAYLRNCLDSVALSTWKDMEIICVDDGSTDRSLEILREYADKDSRIRILTQDHKYAGAARNAGIQAAGGKYIHFLDSDDEILPDAYEKMMAAAEAVDAEVCECLYTNVDAGTGETVDEPFFFSYDGQAPYLSLYDGGKSEYTLIRGHVVPWNKIYLRSFLTENGIRFDDLICAEDRSFYFGVILKARRIVRLQDRFVLHRIRIGTSLDGSDVRLRHFDVEFRSFEHIWELAKDAPEGIRMQILGNCIGDSYFYYRRSVGTPYEAGIRKELYEYWRPYLPICGKYVFKTEWFLIYMEIAAELADGWKGRVTRFLVRRYMKSRPRKDFLARYERAGIRFLIYRILILPDKREMD